MKTKLKLTKHQREAVARILYLVEVLRNSDFVNLDENAFYDGTECDGWCFKDDVTSAAEDLSDAFGVEAPTLEVETMDTDGEGFEFNDEEDDDA